jgi:hypothetical protein
VKRHAAVNVVEEACSSSRIAVSTMTAEKVSREGREGREEAPDFP